MLLSLIGRHQGEGRAGVDRYAAWLAAIQRLRDDWGRAVRPGAEQLPEYLADVPDQQRPEAIQDLVAEHLRLTWQVGWGTILDNYYGVFDETFAELASSLVVPADLVEDEFLARYQLPHGDRPALDEYLHRFSSRSEVIDVLQQRCVDGGRYVKLKKRGQGAMGDVWEAYDRHLQRSVAIKQPKTASADGDDTLWRFAEEARITAGLEHPSIVSVHEYRSRDEAEPFYVMRLVNGDTLAQRICDYHFPPADRSASHQHLLWNQLLQVFTMVCDAIAYAHNRGVLHRDLKPGNVVVGQFGDAVILDWGMAKQIVVDARCRAGSESLTNVQSTEQTGFAQTVVGTPNYMPPEQAEGVADERSDVFGLGAILYEMLTGRSPHAWSDDSRPADWLTRVREAQFALPRRWNPKTPRALEAICCKALSRDPANRYQTAGELGLDIERYRADQTVEAWREPLATKVGRWICQLIRYGL